MRHRGIMIGCHAETAGRWSRNQRDAGLEFKPWAERAAPIRSLISIAIDLMELAGICVMVAGFIALCWMFAG